MQPRKVPSVGRPARGTDGPSCGSGWPNPKHAPARAAADRRANPPAAPILAALRSDPGGSPWGQLATAGTFVMSGTTAPAWAALPCWLWRWASVIGRAQPLRASAWTTEHRCLPSTVTRRSGIPATPSPSPSSPRAAPCACRRASTRYRARQPASSRAPEIHRLRAPRMAPVRMG